MIKQRIVSFFFLTTIIFMNLSCAEKKNKKIVHKEVKKEIEIPEEKVVVKDSIFHLRDLKNKNDIGKSYTAIKEAIRKEKKKLAQKEVPVDSLALVFKRSLVNRIMPFWAGTPWTFEGHTSIPNKGEIACGYFVSTTLKHMGVNVNRYKLAQQSPINEAKSLSLDSNIIKVNEASMKEIAIEIKKKVKDGIHFIGLGESHVGYLLKEKGELYLIHSNFAGDNGVEIEVFEYSDVVVPYMWYYIVELSSNEVFLKNWIQGKEIKIIIS